MRHRNKKGRLSRRTSWRKATLKSLANDLFKYQRIETTMAKAKALRSFAEPLITLAKKNPDSVNARRRAFQKLCDKTTVKNLFDNLGPLYKEIPGGYTRIMALGHRKGDGAETAIIELTKRTISDKDLLGAPEPKEKEKPKKVKGKAGVKEGEVSKAQDKSGKETPHEAAGETEAEEKEKKFLGNTKEKSRPDQKKGASGGIFKRFRRKAI